MAVLERAGEERAPGGASASSSRAVVAEADDHGPRVDAAQRLEQQVDALVLDQLPEVDDRRLVAGEEGREPLGVALVGQPLVGVARVRRIAARLREQIGERLVARPRATNSSTSTPGGTSCTRSTWPTTSSSTLADVGGADEDGARRRPATPAPTPRAPAVPRIEYSSSEPCALTAKRAPVARADRPAEQDVVAKTKSAGRCSRTAAAFASTQRVELRARAVLEQLDLVALVAVEHEDGQQAADVRADDGRAPPGRSAPARGSWQRTTTSCPARLHSRASARV